MRWRRDLAPRRFDRYHPPMGRILDRDARLRAQAGATAPVVIREADPAELSTLAQAPGPAIDLLSAGPSAVTGITPAPIPGPTSQGLGGLGGPRVPAVV